MSASVVTASARKRSERLRLPLTRQPSSWCCSHRKSHHRTGVSDASSPSSAVFSRSHRRSAIA
eukprot:644365-Prymnesium_polylepis.1